MNAAQIAFVINECFEGVERSKIGDVFVKDAEGKVLRDNYGSPIFTTMGSQTFLTVLGCYFPKNYITDIVDSTQ